MNLRHRRCGVYWLFVALAVVSGCTGCTGDSGGATPGSQGRGRIVKASDARIEESSKPYREAPNMALGGTITGFVGIDGDLPADTVTTVTVDEPICGSSLPNTALVHADSGLGNVLVWLTDVQEGKPLPIERRTELLNERCQLVPRVQGVVVGTTVNVRSDDRLPHTTVLLRAGSSDTLGRIPLTDDGQVVPNEKLATKPGMIEARCVQHSWTRGYIGVFGHPYFAVTEATGTFRLDSVPPGRYQLIAWHERGADRIEREVEVKNGEAAVINIKVKLR
jgi:hypothetical protein